MMTISRQDVAKTVIIIWFIATTGYVIYDIYAGYKIRGMQAAYQTGYQTSVDDLLKKVSDSSCQPIEIQRNDKKTQLIDFNCIQKQDAAAQQTPPVAKTPTK
ncbi:MAG: hypothetical protein WA064_01045 [Candidatus Moraniibacteriota bacterium]